MPLADRRALLKAFAASCSAALIPAWGKAGTAMRRVAFLSGFKALNPASPVSVSVEAPGQLRAALQRIARLRPDLLFVANDVAFYTANKEIAAFALLQKWPSIGTVPDWVQAGGLLYFGPDEREAIQRVPRYVVKILQGSRPADLPVEQPSTYRLTINAGTARALGYAISPQLRLRADKVIDG